MKFNSLQDLKPLYNDLIQQENIKRMEYLKNNPPVKKVPVEVCSCCKGSGVVSSQGADVVCPSCKGVGEWY